MVSALSVTGWRKGRVDRSIVRCVRVVHALAQLLQLPRQLGELAGAAAGGLRQLLRNGTRAVAQRTALCRQAHDHAALVVGSTLALEPPGGFHALEQRGQGAGVEKQSLAELADRQRVALP